MRGTVTLCAHEPCPHPTSSTLGNELMLRKESRREARRGWNHPHLYALAEIVSRPPLLCGALGVVQNLPVGHRSMQRQRGADSSTPLALDLDSPRIPQEARIPCTAPFRNQARAYDPSTSQQFDPPIHSSVSGRGNTSCHATLPPPFLQPPPFR